MFSIKHTFKSLIVATTLLLSLTACSYLQGPTDIDKAQLTPLTGEQTVTKEEDESLFEEQAAGKETAIQGKNQIYYFDFDSDQLHQAVRDSLIQQAEYLLAHPDKYIRLEGHTDERGSPEYNIALGWRRAKAVGDFLKQHGVAKKQIKKISFGAQKPAVLGHNEKTWQKNRRVMLNYLTH